MKTAGASVGSLPAHPAPVVAQARMGWIDDLRFVAAGAVVVTHVCQPAIVNVSDLRSGMWWAGAIGDALLRWCLPIFVMISGYLLLSAPAEPLGRFYRRRMERLLLPTVFWSLFYLSWGALGGYLRTGAVDSGLLLGRLVAGEPYYHLWYLYMMPFLYLMTPFLKTLIEAGRRESWIFCGLALGGAVLTNAAQHFTGRPEPFFFTEFLYYLGYFLAGYLLSTGQYSWPAPLLWATALGSATVIVLSSFIQCYLGGDRNILYSQSNLSVGMVGTSLAVFLLARRRAAQASAIFPTRLADLTFGVYLVHAIWLDLFRFVDIDVMSFTPLLSIPLLGSLVFGASLASAWLLRQIPFLRETIR